MPSKKETLTVIVIMALFLLLTAVCIGLRSEHLLMAALYLVLFFAGLPTRKLAVALLPFAIFGISYDWMRICPNYEVNPIDVAGLYNLEKSLFGVMDNGVLVTPCEYFAVHHWAVADVFAGIFYLCWVPVPILFGLCLYFKKERKTYLRFALVFLFVNLIGQRGGPRSLRRDFWSDYLRLHLWKKRKRLCCRSFPSCGIYGCGIGVCYHRQMQMVCDCPFLCYHGRYLGNSDLLLSSLYYRCTPWNLLCTARLAAL